MAKITGIGGIIFKSQDPEALQQWYRKHLGIDTDEHGVASFYWREKATPVHIGRTVLEVFGEDADNFKPGKAPFMVNFRVDNLDEFLAELKAAGIEVLDEIFTFEAGRLGWAIDPEGRKLEFWEPSGEEGQE